MKTKGRALLFSSKQRGFTLVELLIVIVVIAILAAISVVAYRGVTNSAQVAAIKANLSQAVAKLETYRVDNGGYPPDQATLAGLLKFDSSTTLTYAANNSANPQTYCLVAVQGTRQFSVNSASRTPSDSACVVNLAKNPAGTTFTIAATGPGFENTRYAPYGMYSLLTGVTGPVSELTTAARFNVTTAGPSYGFHLSNNVQSVTPGSAMPVTAGTTYTISCWIRKSGTSVPFYLAARPGSDSATWSATTVTGASVNSVDSQWIRLSITYIVPTGSTQLSFVAVTSATSSVGDTIDGTGLMVTTGSTLLNYADGNSPGWGWVGTPNASASIGPPIN